MATNEKAYSNGRDVQAGRKSEFFTGWTYNDENREHHLRGIQDEQKAQADAKTYEEARNRNR